GFHPAAASLRVRGARAPHRRADDADPPRQAPPDLRQQPERGAGEGARAAEPADRAAARQRQLGPRGGARRHPQQRRRALEPLRLLADDGAGRGRGGAAHRAGAGGDRAELRRPRRVQEAVGGGRGGPLRLRVGVAGAPRRQARDHELAQPGQPAHGRRPPRGRAAGPRRVGARLLPQVPEPPPRLRERLVQRGELERGRAPDGGEV
ncbi:MAG: Superoxide dismutase [Mn], partial [uncultured Gemmatimonadaceae bacterium]